MKVKTINNIDIHQFPASTNYSVPTRFECRHRGKVLEEFNHLDKASKWAECTVDFVSPRTRQRLHKGRFDGSVKVCCHRVTFRYWDFGHKLTEDLQEILTDHAEERAKECIIDGCNRGELNCLHVDDNYDDEEIRGWWEIISTD